MDKCPYCGAETRHGDNFCLNCGNRLIPNPSSASQQAAVSGESTMAAPSDWGAQLSDPASINNRVDANADNWANVGGATVAEEEHVQADAPAADPIEDPARFILRAEDGTILDEYPLSKLEISIGRAPNSDILLSKDKLTSRRHATVRYENGSYVLRDERSANGTFVNGQQIEEMLPLILHNGDHVGIGEHELIFRAFVPTNGVDELPTSAVPLDPAVTERAYRSRSDEPLVVANKSEFATSLTDDAAPMSGQAAPNIPVATSYASVPVSSVSTPESSASAPVSSVPSAISSPSVESVSTGTPVLATSSDTAVTFNRLTSIPQPTLPDLTALAAALSTLDGQVMSLQEQFNATQEAMHNHDTDVAQVTSQLRLSLRRVSERMDSTIADVARSREALAWAELTQLMEDVMHNPRDIEYVTRLARKARELNKIFQIHQNVLNTMAECNSLLRGILGEEK